MGDMSIYNVGGRYHVVHNGNACSCYTFHQCDINTEQSLWVGMLIMVGKQGVAVGMFFMGSNQGEAAVGLCMAALSTLEKRARSMHRSGSTADCAWAFGTWKCCLQGYEHFSGPLKYEVLAAGL